MNQNENVYAICCRPEIAGDVFSGGNVNTIEGYAVLNFEVAGFISFWDIKKNHFVTTAAAVAAADVSDTIKRKRIRLKNEATAIHLKKRAQKEKVQRRRRKKLNWKMRTTEEEAASLVMMISYVKQQTTEFMEIQEKKTTNY